MQLGVINQSITWLLNEKYGGKLTEEAIKDIARLKREEPVDYVIGSKMFLGCKIDLRYKPMIPREETEYWVGKAIKKIKKQIVSDFGFRVSDFRSPAFSKEGAGLRILDIFAGSGCIGIAILKNISQAVCDFADIDENCLKQIRLNLKLNKIPRNRYRIIRTNIFNPVLPTNYDVIFANPPYIAFQRKNKVQKSVLNFEPENALFVKSQGLSAIKKFLKQAKQYLKKNGRIYMEFDAPQKRAIAVLLKKFGYSNFIFAKDQFGRWRYVKVGD